MDVSLAATHCGNKQQPGYLIWTKKQTRQREETSPVQFIFWMHHLDRVTNHRFFHLSEKHNLSGLTYWACIPDFSFKVRVSYGALLFDFLVFQQLKWPATVSVFTGPKYLPFSPKWPGLTWESQLLMKAPHAPLSKALILISATLRISTFLGFQIPESFQKRKGISAFLSLG